MSYDHQTRRKAKMQSFRWIAAALVLAAIVAGILASVSLKTYTQLPIPSQLRTIFGFDGFQEFSVAQNAAGIGSALEHGSLFSHLPTNPQSWELKTIYANAKERELAISTILKRSKDATLKSVSTDSIAVVQEKLSAFYRINTEQKALVLAPGEKLNFSATAFQNQSPRIVARCIGVTPDRKDSPASLSVAVGDTPPQPVAISPKGGVVEFTVQRPNSVSPFSIEWPKNAPGILLIQGESLQRTVNTPGVLLVTIDNLNNGLAALPKSNQVLQSQSSQLRHIPSIWPTSSNAREAFAGVFTGQLPANLGITAPTLKFPSGKSLEKPRTLEQEMARLGYKTVRVAIQQGEKWKPSAHPALDEILGLSDFSTLITVQRDHELQQSLQTVFSDFNGDLNGLFIHLNIEMPATHMLETWSSALSNSGSVTSWLASAWFGGKHQVSVRNKEKEMQLDNGLAQLLSKITQRQNHRIVLLAATTNTTISNFTDIPAPHGEAWIPSSMLDSNASGVLSQSTFFQAIPNFSSPRAIKESLATIQTQQEEVFVTEEGWMSYPIPFASLAEEPAPIRSHLPFSAINKTQNAIQKSRENYSIQSINILVANLSARTGVRGTVTIPYQLLTCASSHANDALNFTISGENQNSLQFSAKPERDITKWQLSCLVPIRPSLAGKSQSQAATIALFTGENAMPASEIALGEFALSGKMYKESSTSEQLLIQNPAIVFPAYISPQFRPPFNKSAYFWLERYPSFPSPKGNRS